MISVKYCKMMAHYNEWQNTGLRKMVVEMPEAELTTDRGAFFGSILGTLNHLLWGDQIWMSRFAGLAAPGLSMRQSPTLTPNVHEWSRQRFLTDGAIREWADHLTEVDLVGSLTWYSGAAGAEVTRPLGPLIVHMFNHQTHHRGQVHAMLTAAGQVPGDTDLFLMPT